MNNSFYAFSMLGKYGRLGNQMFQVAAVACLAKRKNFDLILPDKNIAVVRKYFDIPCQDLDENYIKKIKFKWIESDYKFQDLNNLPSCTDILGYLQSLKYLDDPEYIRKKLFKFNENLLEESKQKLKNKKRIAIHVRRGDYLKYSNVHPTLDCEYYFKALKIIKDQDPEASPIIFTDDKIWCQNFLPNLEIFQGEEILDLCMMSICDHIVIANSSFSWWAAWLGEKKGRQVIAPQKWFGQDGPKDWSDLYNKNWRII